MLPRLVMDNFPDGTLADVKAVSKLILIGLTALIELAYLTYLVFIKVGPVEDHAPRLAVFGIPVSVVVSLAALEEMVGAYAGRVVTLMENIIGGAQVAVMHLVRNAVSKDMSILARPDVGSLAGETMALGMRSSADLPITLGGKAPPPHPTISLRALARSLVNKLPEPFRKWNQSTGGGESAATTAKPLIGIIWRYKERPVTVFAGTCLLSACAKMIHGHIETIPFDVVSRSGRFRRPDLFLFPQLYTQVSKASIRLAGPVYL